MNYNSKSASDIIRELAKATACRFSFFCCRLPDADRHIIAYASEQTADGRLRPGLVMASFYNDPAQRLIFCKEKMNEGEMGIDLRSLSTPYFPFPVESTSENAHIKYVSSIIGRLRKRKAEGLACKTVAAKVKRVESTNSPEAIYMRLCEAYPSVFTFYVNDPRSGIWLGASPELLLRIRGRRITTMALAGTRPADSEGEWDSKNREEQAIVARFIADNLEKECTRVDIGKVYTRKAGPVEHLCCDIYAELPGNPDVDSKLEILDEILSSLSPTPALCGFPSKEAFADIKELEGFERGYYGGYLGVIAENGDCDIFANLRSMRLEEGYAALFAGGGIMPESDPAAEWEETERKASTLLRYL